MVTINFIFLLSPLGPRSRNYESYTDTVHGPAAVYMDVYSCPERHWTPRSQYERHIIWGV